jgi:phosphohistidine swiveling domain-containing protein
VAEEIRPQQLPVSEHFHFQWDSPEEANQLWFADLMHWPHGLSTLAATMDMPAFVRGMGKASEALCMPFKAPKFKVIRDYVYMSMHPWSLDPAEMEHRMQDMQEKMMQHIPGLVNRWNTVYEPEVRVINDKTYTSDYKKMTDTELSDFIESLLALREREGEIHFLAVFPAGGGVAFFEETYTELFGEPKGGEHYQLLQGFPNKSTETAIQLALLAKEVRKRPQVLELLRTIPLHAVHAKLDSADGGSVFRGAVQEFLNNYGWRANELDFAEPTWAEQPAPVYNLIKEYAIRDDYDPEEEQRSLASARQAREKLLESKLAGEDLGKFKMSLIAAQQYLPIQEDHNFWIDQVGVCVQRLPVLEAARRLVAAGKINAEADVFFLEYAQLQDAIRDGGGNLQQVVEQRKKQREENLKLAPPEALGTPLPPEADNPLVSKFFGGQPEKNPDPRVINGNGASAGQITGTARVIMSLDHAERLNHGEILVCPATMPPWTPLFAIASAVVTDHGGVLSHTAIVAREYQIPAVIGTKVATSLIRDGSRITVDGTEGTVRMED